MSTTSNTYNTTPANQKPGFQQEQPGFTQQAYNSSATDGAGNNQTDAPISDSGMIGTQHPAMQDQTREWDSNQSAGSPDRFDENAGRRDDSSMNDSSMNDPASIQSGLNARDPPIPYPAEGGVTGQNERRDGQPYMGGISDSGSQKEQLPSSHLPARDLPAGERVPGDDYTRSSQQNSSGDDGGSGAIGYDHRDYNQGGQDYGTSGPVTAPGSGQYDQSYDRQDSGTGQGAQATDTEIPSNERAQQRSGKDGPSTADKIKGNILIAKGKLFHGQEEIQQGQNLKETGRRDNYE